MTISNITTPEFTVFYDGNCPLCIKEINHLHKLDTKNKLKLVNIHSSSFNTQYPDLDKHTLSNRIHGLTAEGQMLTGLDVTYLAWKQVGKGWVYAPLRWPVIRWFADHTYNWFAKHRHTIARLVTGKKPPTCKINKDN